MIKKRKLKDVNKEIEQELADNQEELEAMGFPQGLGNKKIKNSKIE